MDGRTQTIAPLFDPAQSPCGVQQGDACPVERARLALDAGRMGSWRWDIAAGVVTGDTVVAELFGLDYAAQPWPVDDVFSLMHPEDLQNVQRKVDEALAGKDIYETEFRDGRVDPASGERGTIWLGARGSVTKRAPDGTPLEMIGVNWDMTRQKTHEAQLSLLASEMDHRVKNAFAVIRALINLGEHLAVGKEEFAQTLRNQLHSIADAYALSASMTREALAPVNVPMGDVIEHAMEPWCVDPVATISIRINAEDATLAPNGVSAMAMLVNELATNALKHGALGEKGGVLGVSLTPAGDRVRFEWREERATAAAAEAVAPDGKGFGTTLLGHCVKTLRGTMTRAQKGCVRTVTVVLPLNP